MGSEADKFYYVSKPANDWEAKLEEAKVKWEEELNQKIGEEKAKWEEMKKVGKALYILSPSK